MDNKLLESFDIDQLNNKVINPSIHVIYEDIIINSEGVLGQSGALMVDTGEFTGRSPKDKYFVEEDLTKHNLWWGPVNRKIDIDIYNKLHNKVINYYLIVNCKGLVEGSIVTTIDCNIVNTCLNLSHSRSMVVKGYCVVRCSFA